MLPRISSPPLLKDELCSPNFQQAASYRTSRTLNPAPVCKHLQLNFYHSHHSVTSTITAVELKLLWKSHFPCRSTTNRKISDGFTIYKAYLYRHAHSVGSQINITYISQSVACKQGSGPYLKKTQLSNLAPLT